MARQIHHLSPRLCKMCAYHGDGTKTSFVYDDAAQDVPRVLTPDQIEHFLTHGYVRLKECFTRAQAAEWSKELWVRLGMDPNDSATWTTERVHMPVHRRFEVSEFSPKAWNAILDLVGGETRIDPAASSWTDSFIVNLGPPSPSTPSTFTDTVLPSPTPSAEVLTATVAERARALNNWHVDGDFFVHFLDSREQALLVVPLLSDIAPGGGATFIAPDSVGRIAAYLRAHPEGVIPKDRAWTPTTYTGTNARDDPDSGMWDHVVEARKCEQFVELTGEVGDVVLLHPFMLHSASPNLLRIPRVITNPPVGLAAPFNYNRASEREYSVVESATLRAMGLERCEFTITGERKEVVPLRVLIQREMIEKERKRLEELREKAESEGTGTLQRALVNN